jgi:16S rRNA (adenine1518-N6/adenine1519-N6)-dimethyltransferase
VKFNHKKSLSQNFLTSKGMQEKIIKTLRNHMDSYELPLVEIGPGVGDLTQYFVDLNPLLLEIDSNACKVLQEKFTELKICQVDALEVVETRKPAVLPENFYLFSNLPYHVGSRILMALGMNYPSTPFTVILQAEVAYKASPERSLTFMGAWLNYIWDLQVKFKISKGNFTPTPRVESALLQGTPREINQIDLHLKFKILKSLFAFPNKTLSNNLRGLGWSVEQIAVFHDSYSIAITTRLTWGNYGNILESVYSYDKKLGASVLT